MGNFQHIYQKNAGTTSVLTSCVQYISSTFYGGFPQRVLDDLQRTRLYRGRMIWLLPQSPPPPPPPAWASYLSFSIFLCVTGELTERGEKWGRSQPKSYPGLALCKSFHTLWVPPSLHILISCFYVRREEGAIVLVEERSGAEQVQDISAKMTLL